MLPASANVVCNLSPAAVRSLLSWQPLVTLSRLSYNVYLVHYILQVMWGAALRDPVNTTFITIVSSLHV